MVDKAKKRLKALAAEQGIGLRAAGNIMAERRPPAERVYGRRGGSHQKAPVENGAFVFNGTSDPPDGDGTFPGDGPALGVFPRKYVAHYVFVDLDEGRRRLGLALSDPPVTGGFVIDKFEYPPDATQAELLAEAERRNGPLRIQYPDNELGESYPATASGVDEAHMVCSALAQRGREIRLVSSQGVLLKHWNEPRESAGTRTSEALPPHGYFSFGDSVSRWGGTPLGDSVSGTGGAPLKSSPVTNFDERASRRDAMQFPSSESLGYVRNVEGALFHLHFYGENEGAAVVTGPIPENTGRLVPVAEFHRESPSMWGMPE